MDNFKLQQKALDVPQNIPAALPLLTDFVSWVKSTKSATPFANHAVLFIQHQLGDIVCQAESFLELGALPSLFWWMSIPYTEHAEVMEHMHTNCGIPESHLFRHEYTLSESYEPYMRSRTQMVIKAVLDGMRAKSCDRLLVIDDGSYFIDALASMEEGTLQGVTCKIVEQTTRGIIKLRDAPALWATAQRFPLINVAESLPKRTLEPPYVAEAVVLQMLACLLRDAQVPAGKCLILGYGAIGSALVSWLVLAGMFSTADFEVWDPVEASCARAAERGLRIWDKDATPSARFAVVIGCAGRPSFSPKDVGWLVDDALLISASSGTQELSFHDFCEQAARGDGLSMPDPAALCSPNIHQNVVFATTAGSRFCFVNGGLPVTFCGRLNPTLADKFSGTCVCMLGAAVQAVETDAVGLQALDEGVTQWVMVNFAKLEQEQQWKCAETGRPKILA